MEHDREHEEIELALERERQARLRLDQQAQQAQQAQDQARLDRIQAAIVNSKIPDTIKGLPCFSGENDDLTHWLFQVQAIVDAYRELHEEPIWLLWLCHIRGKVTGKAHKALTSANIPNDWARIRATLIEHFGNNRELSSLCQAIPYLSQGRNSVEDFYHEVTTLQAKVNEKINLEPTYRGHTAAVSHFAATLMKEAFIDGLNEPYSALVRGSDPRTMVDAFNFARRQCEADVRKNEKAAFTKKAADRRFDRQNVNSAKPNQKSQSANFSRPAQQNSNFARPPQNANRFSNQNAAAGRFPAQNANAARFPSQSAPAARQAVEQMEVDPTVQSRRSVQPMSVSQRFRPAQVTSTELHDAESEEEVGEVEGFFDDEDCGETDLNFHLALQLNPGT